MVISGAPVSVLIDHALPEGILEQLVGAGIGTVERLGSMTPEELEAIPGIDENTVETIQAAVVSFYNQYDSEQDELAPVDAESIEGAIDESTRNEQEEFLAETESPAAFDNIETGVLEHDIATHEAALLEDTDEGEILDLGRVEGLSGAPSALRNLVQTDEIGEDDPSDTMKKSSR
jgi:N utilization substance protein A